jgi:hypothetical protein
MIMHSPSESDAIWTADARTKVQQEFGWGGGVLFEKYCLFLAAFGWARPGETVVEVFAEWAREGRPA